MPTYEYLCQACNHRFEQWQHMIDDPLTICPECGGHIRRVFYPAGIVFKGHGFYKTDHGSSSVAESNGNGHNGHGGHNGDNAKGETAAKEGKTGGETSASDGNKSSASTGSESKAAASTTAK